MVHGSRRKILTTTSYEHLMTGRAWIAREIVQFEDLLQVGEVILPGVAYSVCLQMLQGGDRA